MKFITFETGRGASFGLWSDEGVVDLGARLKGAHAGLPDFIAAGGRALLTPALTARADHAHTDVRLLQPLPAFGKCFCVGVNYPERNAEFKDGSDQPKYPSLFVRFPESFTGPGEPLMLPPESRELDYEGEVVLVIGRRGRRIPESAWRDHIFGFTIANEGTVRDWVRHGKFNVTPGKNWARSGAMGPWIVSADEAREPFRIITRVNGAERQNDTTDRMMFPFARIVSYISTFATLEPGDIILTGTPGGAGARLDPPQFLKAGDKVEIEVSGLGRLVNEVAAET